MKTTIAMLFLALPTIAEEKVVPKVPIGKETTYIDGPLDNDGYIDYEAALNERLAKGIKPETNANVLIVKVLGPKPLGSRLPPEYYKRLGIDEPPENGDYFLTHYEYRDRHLKSKARELSDSFAELLQRASERPWKSTGLPHIAPWLALNDKRLDLVVEASQRTQYYNPVVTRKSDNEVLFLALMPTHRCIDLTRALCARAMQRIADGKNALAWQDLLACHRLARHVARGILYNEMALGISLETIASNADLAYLENAKLTSAELLKHIKDLQSLPSMPVPFDKVIEGQRFVFLDSLQMLRRSGAKGLYKLVSFPPKREFPWERVDQARANQIFNSIDWEPAYRNGNRWFDRLAEALRAKTYAERTGLADRLIEDLDKLLAEKPTLADAIKQAILGPQAENKIDSKRISDLYVRQHMLTNNHLHLSEYCDLIHHNLQLAFALAAYRKDNKRYPANLNDLAPKYLAAVPNDIFSAKALKYRPTDNGYLLYSVGINGKDEEGRWHDDDPPGDDPRVIMPLPELKIRR